MDFSRYTSLSENAQQLLCFYATYAMGLKKRMTELWYMLSRYCFPRFEGSAALKELKEAGIFIERGRDWFSNSQMYSLNDKDIALAMMFTYMEHSEWLDTFKRTKMQVDNDYEALRSSLRQYADSDMSNATMAGQVGATAAEALISVANQEGMSTYLANLPYPAIVALCEKAFAVWSSNDQMYNTRPLVSAIKRSKTVTEVQRSKLLAMWDLYTYMFTGVAPLEGVYQQTPEGKTQIALMSAVTGKYEQAADLFEQALDTRGIHIAKDKEFSSVLLNMMYVLSLMHINTPASKVRLKLWLDHANPGHFVVVPAALLADDFLGKKSLDPEHFLTLMYNTAMKDRECMALKSYAYLITAYFGRSLLNMVEWACVPNMALLRHEMLPFINVPDSERDRLNAAFGTNLVLNSIPHKAEWQHVLDMLTAEVTGTGVVQTVPENVRMMYVRHHVGSNVIEVREQKRLKNGTWGSGKIISDSKYRYCTFDYMTDADRRIQQRYNASRHYQLELSDCIEDLVGSDRLYYGSYSPFEHVTVERDKPYLIVEKEGVHFIVKSNVTLAALAYDPIIVENSTTHYTVMSLTDQERRWYKTLLSTGSFPLNAEESLREFLPTIGGKIEVHSSLIEGGSTLPKVEGVATIGFKLCPRNNGNYEVNVFTRPLVGGTRTYTPGKGDSTIIDENEEGRVRVERDLALEKQNLKEAKALWKEADIKMTDTGEYTPDFVLDLIHIIQENPDTYYAEWPEGQSMRLRALHKGATSWNGVLKDRGQWFEIEGDIQIDNETVISISQLLELISHSSGRYIRMGDGEYLALSEKLKRQLLSLNAVANRERGKLKISPFSAAMMNDEMINGEITFALDQRIQDTRQRIVDSSDYRPPVPAELNAQLRPYQIDGYQWIARLNSWGAGALLADDMGLGKTVQTIAFLLHKQHEGPSLVVAPASVAPNWLTEFDKFAPTLRTEMLNYSPNRKKTIDDAKAGDVVVTTYGILLSVQELITAKQWNVVCLDEAHIIKNRGAKTSAAAMRIQAANRVMLTGTPVQNHLGELWSLFQFVNPGLLGGYENFSQKFIIPIEGNHDKEKQRLLDQIVRPFMLRRTKQAVLKELPDKTEIYHDVVLSKEELAIYESIRMRAEKMLEDNMTTKSAGSEVDMNVLAEITRLRQASCSAQLIESKWTGESTKVTTLVEMLLGIIEGDNRALVFSQFVSFFDIVRRALDQHNIPYLYIDGSVPVKRRTELVNKFQKGKCPVFLISLKAGGLGLNLTGANYVIHLDPWWNPAIEQQATDRAYRIGQQQAVTVYHLVSKNTIEEKIIRLHQTKRDLADSLLAGTDMSHKLTGKELLDMLKK